MTHHLLYWIVELKRRLNHNKNAQTLTFVRGHVRGILETLEAQQNAAPAAVPVGALLELATELRTRGDFCSRECFIVCAEFLEQTIAEHSKE